MKDDSRSRKPSASRSEVNAELIGQIVFGDCRLNVRMIVSRLYKKKEQCLEDYPRRYAENERQIGTETNDDQKKRGMQGGGSGLSVHHKASSN